MQEDIGNVLASRRGKHLSEKEWEPLQKHELDAIKKYLIANKPQESVNDEFFSTLDELFETLTASFYSTQGLGPLRVLASDTLAIWLVRATQVLKNRSIHKNRPTEVLNAIQDDSAVRKQTQVKNRPTEDLSASIEDLSAPIQNDFRRQLQLVDLFAYTADFLQQQGSKPLANSLNSLLPKLLAYSETFAQDAQSHQGVLMLCIRKTLSLPYTTKGYYNLMELLIKHLPASGGGVSTLIGKFPEFSHNCIDVMWSNALANSAAKAFVALYQKSSALPPSASQKDQQDVLWKQLLSSTADIKLRKNILVYLLPLLFNAVPDSYQTFLTTRFPFDLTNDNSTSTLSEGDIELITGLLRIGQDLSIIPNPFNPSPPHPSPVSIISVSTLNQLLTHQNERFRLGAFQVLVGSITKEGAKPVPQYVYDTIILHKLIPTFLKDSDTIEVRIDFVALLRHLIIRVHDSCCSTSREINKLSKSRHDHDNDAKISNKQEYLENSAQFLQHILSTAIRSIRPASSYCQLSLSLQIIAVFVELKIHDVKYTKLPFTVSVYSSESIQLLFNNITNNYEDVRQLSAQLLLACPTEMLSPVIDDKQIIGNQNSLVEKTVAILYDLKGRKSEGGAKVLQFLAQFYVNSNQLDKSKALMKFLLSKLDIGLAALSDHYSLTDDAGLVKHARVHGFYTAIRLILENVDISSIFADENDKELSVVLAEIIENRIVKLWEIIKPVLSNTTEQLGQVPDSAADDEDDFVATGGAENRVIVRFGWKAVKESTTLLNSILKLGSKVNGSTKLSDSCFLESASLIMDQLASVKHRGAFSSVYPSFVLICTLFRGIDSLKHYPRVWLDANLGLIESKSQYISRRSGGLPYLITGILTAEIGTAKLKVTQNSMSVTFTDLLRIAQLNYTPNADEKLDIPQVHAFNCMRHIFIDAQLAHESTAYIRPALQLALTHCNNDTWAIRNCAVMLFTALQNRLFGTDKLGDSLPSMSVKVFFSQYPGIDDILHDLLSDATDIHNAGGNKWDIIFPILTLLSRLESFDNEEIIGIDRFHKLLRDHCLGNGYWKIREMAARSYVSILSPSQLTSTAEEFLHECSALKSHDQNRVHGYLLTIKEIVGRIKSRKFVSWGLSEEFRSQVYSHYAVFLGAKVNWITAKSYFSVLEVLCQDTESEIIPLELLHYLGNFMLENLMTEEHNQHLNGSRSLALSYLMKFLLKEYAKEHMYEQLVDLVTLSLLCVHEYELQLATIDFCNTHLSIFTSPGTYTHNDGGIDYTQFFDELWRLVNNEESWSHVRSRALGLVQALSSNNISFSHYESALSTLFSFAAGDYGEDVNSKALDALGPVIAQCGADDYTEHAGVFLDLCEKFADDATPFTVRYSAVHAVVHFCILSTKLGKFDKYTARAYCIIHSSLSDDDEDIRNLAVDAFCEIFQHSHHGSSSITSEQFAGSFLSMFCGDAATEVLVDYFIQSKPQISYRLIETASQTEDSPFEVESLNLYRDDISKRVQIIAAIREAHKRKPLSSKCLRSLKVKILTDLDRIHAFAENKGSDGLVGWSKDDFVFTSTTESVLDAKMYLSLKPDDEVAASLHKVVSLLNTFDLNLAIKNIIDSFT